ncbi:MAG: pyridoxamine 5'-phosphate oxidase [Planctomycetes bacterium]|nr:pyridoxamine 5'-phosphate oxidase [Planctomycetota bacterium]
MDFDHPPADPIAQLNRWLEEAKQTDLRNPHAMSLATIDPDGRPSVRVVLLKGLDGQGAVFYTNRISRKGRALESNPSAALLFHWDTLQRQVSVEGRVSVVEDAQCDAYFATRPRSAQIGAWASLQSQPIESRAALLARVAQIERRYEGRDVPRPPHWGGYRVSLDCIEFWQGRPDRLHDRVAYTRDDQGGWTTQRLCP